MERIETVIEWRRKFPKDYKYAVENNHINHICKLNGWELPIPRTYNNETFIEKSVKVHGNKYQYLKVNYENISTKVIITCKEHGDFQQTPTGHLQGRGCLKCSGKLPLTTDSFIEKAIKIHGDKYKYLKVNYINSSTKVIITCKEHEDFQQTPNAHLQGGGCLKCGGSFPLTTDSFIERAVKIHGYKYEYLKVNYKNNFTKVIITCKEHGDFEQVPTSHLQGKGCIKCSHKSPIITDLFIEKAVKIHRDKYQYIKVNYINLVTKVIITCKEHGDFQQTPASHLRGNGCSKCIYKNRRKIL